MTASAKKILISLGLLGLTFLVFGRAVTFDWVRYDDSDYVYRSAAVTSGLSFSNLAWAFTHVHASNWHPLTTISLMLDCQLFGVRPGPMHGVNVLLHGFAAVLLFWALVEMTDAFWRSVAVATLFAIHPLRAESVAWIAERKDVLSGFFFALLLLCYARYAGKTSFGRYLLICLAAALGLLAKPMLVTIPFVLLLLDFWPLQRFRQRSLRFLLLEKLPLLLLAAGVVIATLLAQRGAIAMGQLPFSLRFQNAIVSYAIYLRQTFWPVDLAALYQQPESFYPWPIVLISAAVIAAITAAVLATRRRNPFLVTGWLWFLGMLVPVIGLVQVGRQSHADRYTYLPQIGIFIALVWFIGGIAAVARRQHLRNGLALLSISLLAVLTYHQVGFWRNAETLWPHTIAVTENNDGAHLAFATALISSGKTEQAMAHLQRATAIRPSNAGVFGELPSLATKEQIEAGIAFWSARLEEAPRDLGARTNLGVLLARNHQPRDALAQWEKVLQLAPGDGNAESNIAWVLSTAPDAALRNGPRAVALGEHIVDLAGGRNPIVLRTLAAAYAESGRFAEATHTAERARDIAAGEGNQPLATELSETITRYQNGLPFRDPSLTQ